MAAHGLLFPATYRRTFFFPRTSALLRNRPAKAAFFRLIPRLRLTTRHAMGMDSSHAHGNSLMGVLGCGRRLSTFPCAQGHVQRQKSETLREQRISACVARAATLNVCRRCITRSHLRGAQGSCATPSEGESMLPLARLRRPMRGNGACNARPSPRGAELCMSCPPTMGELNVPGCDSERTP